MMSILFCVSITWITLCFSFMGLVLIFLLVAERAPDTSQAIMADECVSDQALRIAKLDLSMDEPVQQARELADIFDALPQFEGPATLAPHDEIPTAHSAVSDRTQRTGAMIIRDPRLTRARVLCDRSAGAEQTVARTSATQEIGAISQAMKILSTEGKASLGANVAGRP
jgi:hypothetical protein